MKALGWGIVGLALIAGCSGSAVRETAASKDKAAKRASLVGAEGCAKLGAFLMGDLDTYQSRVDDISARYQREQWLVETADSHASEKKMSEAFAELQKISYDPAVLEEARKLNQSSLQVRPESCADKRRLTRAHLMLEAAILTKPEVIKREKENQDKQDALIKESNAFRMNIPGEAEPVSRAIYGKILGSTSDRRKREALYREYSPARAHKWLDIGFRELVKARNEEAKAAGYSDYYAYRFFRNQLDLANYRTMVGEIKRKLAPKVRKVIRDWGRAAKYRTVEPWDLRYLREQAASGEINDILKELPETAPLDMARKFYAALGIDIDEYKFQMDLYPRPGKNTHAFAMGIVFPHVDKQGNLLSSPTPDIRFLANLKKPVKWDDISTVIHELGHAVHSAEVRQPVGLFRGIGSVETEAIAMTLERMAATPEHVKSVIQAANPQLGSDKVEAIVAKQLKAARIEQAMVLLRQVFFSDFEYEMYHNPDADYGELWSKMHEIYWGVKVDPKLADWDVEHFLMAPVYVQNYAIGILMVEQLYASMLADFKTGYDSKELGNKLRRVYFAPGMEYDYLDLTKAFTGKPLTAAAALKLLD